MHYLIIESHPYESSFNAGAVKAIKDKLEQKGHSVQSIDLVIDGFDPVMKSEDLKVWGQGKSVDSMVPKYQALIEKADILIFPFPIWWGTMPAVLKGFCDKVLLPGWAYKHGSSGEMIGLLNMKKAVVITTMETPIDVYENYFNNPIEGAFIKDTLQTCGIEVLKHFQIDKLVSGGKEYTESKMEEIVNYFSK